MRNSEFRQHDRAKTGSPIKYANNDKTKTKYTKLLKNLCVLIRVFITQKQNFLLVFCR